MNLPPISGMVKGGRNTAVSNIKLPTVQPGQDLPLSTNTANNIPQAPAPQPLANATPQNVLQTAQNRAMGSSTTPVQQLVSQQTQNMLNPAQPFDEQAFVQTAIDKANREQAQGFEQARQSMGGVSNVGLNDKALAQFALQGRQQVADLKRTAPVEARNAALADMAQRIDIGNKTAAQESAIRAQDIQNLVAVRGAAEGDLERDFKMTTLFAEQDFQKEMTTSQQAHALALQNNDIKAASETLKKQLDFETSQASLGREFTAQQNLLNRALQENLAALDINGQKELMGLKSKLDSEQFVMESEFNATQADLDRQLQAKIQQGDIAGQVQLMNLKAQLDETAAVEQREHETLMFKAQSALQKDMQLTDQEYEAAQKLLDRQLQESMQTKDIEGQKAVATLQSNLELERMTQGLSLEEKRMRLDDELATARANGDVERQKKILSYQADENIRAMVKQSDLDTAMASTNAEIQRALANNDYQNAALLQESQNRFLTEQAMLDRSIEEKKVLLQEKGANMADIQAQYEMIQAEIAAGRAHPDSAVNFLQAQIQAIYPDGDYEITAPDPLSAQKAVEESFRLDQLQFALRNPGTGDYDNQGNFVGLKEESKPQFVKAQNEALFGVTGTPAEEEVQRIKDGGNFEGLTAETAYNDPVYKALLADPSVVKFSTATRTAGNKRTTEMAILNSQAHTGGLMNMYGTIFRLDSQERIKRNGVDDASRYGFTNPVTGEKISVEVYPGRTPYAIMPDGRQIDLNSEENNAKVFQGAMGMSSNTGAVNTKSTADKAGAILSGGITTAIDKIGDRIG